ncbi:hypothetical protein SF123566_0766 [Shigella flexneri 1235-66]|nr:hypothetical protein SF123566_0766 [Shigella flexneri 1235-66]
MCYIDKKTHRFKKPVRNHHEYELTAELTEQRFAFKKT